MTDASWSFPLWTDARGRFQLFSGKEAVEQAYRMILGTVAGERVMRPDLGIQLDWRTEELPERIQDLLTEAEPRASITRVEVSATQPPGTGTFLSPVAFVTVDYQLKRTGERHVFRGVIDWIL